MDIPLVIMTEILLRLPAKSLGQFKSVSKSWLAQISEPQFIKDHLNTYKRTRLICDSDNGSIYSLSFNQLDDEIPKFSLVLPYADCFTFLGSCNGLVLGSAYSSSVDDYHVPHPLVILNPTTNELIELPITGYEMMLNNYVEANYTCGFGYDSFTDDYKVVTLCYFHYYDLSTPPMYVHMYSLRNKTWRRVMDYPYDYYLGNSMHNNYGSSLPGVLAYEFLHWIANKPSHRLPVLVAFSLVDETFSEVPLLNLENDVDIMSKDDCKLFLLGEKLGIFVEDEVCVMNEYAVRESWSKIVIYGLKEMAIDEPKIFYQDGNILLASDNLMWVYDVEDKSFIKTIDISRNIEGLMVKGAYVESLVSPKY